MTDQENAAERTASHYFCLISNVPREHAWLNIDMQTELSPCNVAATIPIARIQSINNLAKISIIKMWSGMPPKRCVQKQKREERDKIKETSIAATATTE